MTSPKRTFLQVIIDPDKKQKFVDKLKEEGKNITDVIMEFVDDYLDESEKVDVVEISERLQKLENYVYSERGDLLGEIAA